MRLLHNAEAIAVALRQTLLLPLDDLPAVTRECVCEGVSRSGLAAPRGVGPDGPAASRGRPRGRRQGVPGLRARFVHVDPKYLPQMPEEDARRDLFAGIDRATRRVYVEVLPEKSAACARGVS